jgi:ATP-dependent DNA helicase RecG
MTDADFEALVNQQSADEIFTQKIHPDPENFTQIIHPEGSPKITQKKIGKTAQAIIDALIADPTLTRKGLADLLGKSEDIIKYHLATLQARKIILHIGPDYGGHWKVLIKK